VIQKCRELCGHFRVTQGLRLMCSPRRRHYSLARPTHP
jgi:hypothetical protein